MFRRYNPSCNEESDTENWSFPSSFERFNTANVPKSRLGKRRTIDPSTDIKKDVLNNISTEPSNGYKVEKEVTNSYSQSSSLTHPATPTHKRVNHFHSYKYNQESDNSYKVCNRNLGSLTPFRTESSQPLKEIKNFLHDQKLNPDPGIPIPSLRLVDSSENGSSDIQKILNKSFEISDGLNCIPTDANTIPTAVNNAETHPDSSHSDLGNNSSFMTAQDIYNVDRGRLYTEPLSLKTPHKGYSLLDMIASPVDPLNNLHLQTENESLKNMFAKTPCINRLEPYKTPFKSRAADVFTPTFNTYHKKPMVMNKQLCTNLSFQSEPVISEKESSAVPESRTTESSFFAKISPTDENGMSDGVTKPSPSYVKRQIFEGLGWLPPASFSIQSKGVKPQTNKAKEEFNPESSTVLLTSNESTSDSCRISTSQLSSTEIDIDGRSSSCTKQKESSIEECHSSSFQAVEPSVYEECYDGPTVVEPDISTVRKSTVNERVHTSIERETTNKQFENDMDISEDKTNIGNQRIKSSFIESSCMSVERLNLDSTHQNGNEITVSNDSGMCNDESETDLRTVDEQQPTERDVTVIVCDPQKIEKAPSVPNVQNEQPPKVQNSNQMQDHAFLAPQPILSYQRPIPKPQANVVYVNQKPYTVLSMLGKGGSSEVYQVLDTDTSKLMAMKFVNLSSVEDTIATGYLNEIKVLSKLQGCPSVIRMFDSQYISESKILYVVMEKGDIDFSRLMKDIMKTKKISMPMIIYYWTEMLSCVKDIHEKGIIHSDLKPANFLLVSGRLKLIDFGIASSLQGDMTSVLKDATTGTFNYMSPEAIRNNAENNGYKITYKSDVWSLGCILYNLLYGKTPFSHLTNTWTKLSAIADPSSNVSFPSDKTTPPHLLYSIRLALEKDPKKRPTAAELLTLAEITPGPETQLGKQMSCFLDDYIAQMFPNCSEKMEKEKNKNKKF